GLASVGLAHHPFSSEFDASKPVTITGTVSRIEWTAPHVYVFMDSKDVNGKTASWKLEGANPNTLEGNGWKSAMLKKGDRITAMAFRAMDGSNLVSARSIKLANGRTL